MIKKRKCEWINDDRSTCQDTIITGFSYCQSHYERAYQKGTALRKRKKDIRIAEKIFDVRSIMNEIAETI